MAIKRVPLLREINFWLSLVTDSAGVGKSKLPSGKTVTDLERLDYIKQRLQRTGAKLLRESIERDQKAFPVRCGRYRQLGK